ncbi:MAG TPA: histidine phosphatase family protein [Burkholderiaceae bacterium]|nr:histidine phosphatase family protein [Burkholderiaceae bacterium]
MTLTTDTAADPPSSPVLQLVRHARVMLPAGTCYGATDAMADPQQTAQVAATLIDALPQGASMLSSPLQRCAVLAHAVARARTDLSLRFEPRITEMDFGCWEGSRWDAIPRSAFEAWTTQFAHHRFGGAESVQALMERVAAVWDESCDTQAPQVWITHAGVMNAAALLAQGITAVGQADQWPRQSPAYGARVLLPMQRIDRASSRQV